MPAALQPAQHLKLNTAGLRLSFRWLGMRKALSKVQRHQAASAFNAQPEFLSASQKILDTKHPAVQKLTSLKNDIIAYWRAHTLPYTEDGIRLLPKSHIHDFATVLGEFRQRFTQTVNELDDAFDELKAQAQAKLGTLYDPANYPDSIKPYFAFEWDFPNLEPPNYLKVAAPELYAQESAKAAARFKEAVQLATQAFTQQFGELLTHLVERLQPDETGQKKAFRDSAVKNLHEFFDQFNALNIGSSAELEKLIASAKDILQGIEPQDLRDSQLLRQQITEQLAKVEEQLTPMIANAPRRKLILKDQPCQENSTQTTSKAAPAPAASLSPAASLEAPAA